MLVQQVQLVVITDLENVGSNLHAARIALAAVVIDQDLRTLISPKDFALDCKPKLKTQPTAIVGLNELEAASQELPKR
jgi:hypothetical protein